MILARREEMVPLMSPGPDVVRFHTANDFLPMSEHPVALVEPYSFGPVQIISAPVRTRCTVEQPVVHTRPAGPPHEVLASHAYLELLLFDYAESEVRAKTHGRYQMVCKAWQVK